ncbi:MAG: YggT family protein, partial [Ottowia sp.]|nr:YggT family protein [Ottowia sp.]
MVPCRPRRTAQPKWRGKWADERPMTAFNEIFVYLLQTFLSLYLVAMLLRFLLQLVRADFYNPISQF